VSDSEATSQARTQTALDPYTILADIGVEGASQAEIFAGGSDTSIWRIMWYNQPYALRVFPPGYKNRFDNEIAAMRAAAAGGIPVPEVIRQEMWQDRPILLLSWIRGNTLSQQLMSRPHLGWKLGGAFGHMQAKMHQMPISDSSASISTHWIEWAGDEPELKVRLYDLNSRRSNLIHLDYHPLNVMTDGTEITGVLDWANAHIGDSRADFARTYTILRVEPFKPSKTLPVITVFRRTLEYAWRSGYLAAGGDLGSPQEMALFYAWAGAAMIHDLGRKIGRPGHWLRDQHLKGVRYWRDEWKRRAGVR
jgi:aminoglycoside phosphotransferase (APT) family kinase protein